MPDNAPHNALRDAVNRSIANGSPVVREISQEAFDAASKLFTRIEDLKAMLQCPATLKEKLEIKRLIKMANTERRQILGVD